MDFVKIEDNCSSYSVDHFAIPKQYKDYIDRVVFPHGLIMDRTEALAQKIHEHYAGENVTLVCVLKGAFRFCQDLMTFINNINKVSPPDKCVQGYIEFIKAKSYLNDQQGSIKIDSSDQLHLNEKNVLIVEDIIDTGRTMEKLLKKINVEYQIKSLKAVSLMAKRKENSTGYRPDFLGFEIPDIWITGYGGFHVVVLNQKGRDKFGV